MPRASSSSRGPRSGLTDCSDRAGKPGGCLHVENCRGRCEVDPPEFALKSLGVSRRRPDVHAAVLGTLKAAPVGVRVGSRLPYRLGRPTRFPTPCNSIHSDENRALRLPNVAQRRDTSLILPRLLMTAGQNCVLSKLAPSAGFNAGPLIVGRRLTTSELAQSLVRPVLSMAVNTFVVFKLATGGDSVRLLKNGRTVVSPLFLDRQPSGISSWLRSAVSRRFMSGTLVNLGLSPIGLLIAILKPLNNRSDDPSRHGLVDDQLTIIMTRAYDEPSFQQPRRASSYWAGHVNPTRTTPLSESPSRPAFEG